MKLNICFLIITVVMLAGGVSAQSREELENKCWKVVEYDLDDKCAYRYLNYYDCSGVYLFTLELPLAIYPDKHEAELYYTTLQIGDTKVIVSVRGLKFKKFNYEKKTWERQIWEPHVDKLKKKKKFRISFF